jgi:hypothetical protein
LSIQDLSNHPRLLAGQSHRISKAVDHDCHGEDYNVHDPCQFISDFYTYPATILTTEGSALTEAEYKPKDKGRATLQSSDAALAVLVPASQHPPPALPTKRRFGIGEQVGCWV